MSRLKVAFFLIGTVIVCQLGARAAYRAGVRHGAAAAREVYPLWGTVQGDEAPADTGELTIKAGARGLQCKSGSSALSVTSMFVPAGRTEKFRRDDEPAALVCVDRSRLGDEKLRELVVSLTASGADMPERRDHGPMPAEIEEPRDRPPVAAFPYVAVHEKHVAFYIAPSWGAWPHTFLRAKDVWVPADAKWQPEENAIISCSRDGEPLELSFWSYERPKDSNASR